MPGPNRDRLSLPLVLRRGVMVLVLFGVAIAWTGCQPPATPAAQTQLGVTIDEIVADPQRFLGQTVSAQAEVARVVNERVIMLQSQTSSSEMVAVLANQAMQGLGSVQAGQAVRVVGTVQPLTQEEIRQVEQQLGIQLDERLLLSLANQAPFIVVADANR